MPSCHIFMRINVKTLSFSCLYNYIMHYYRIKYYVYLTTTKSITLKQSLVPHPGNLITDSYHKTLCLRCMFTFLCSAADEARDSTLAGHALPSSSTPCPTVDALPLTVLPARQLQSSGLEHAGPGLPT